VKETVPKDFVQNKLSRVRSSLALIIWFSKIEILLKTHREIKDFQVIWHVNIGDKFVIGVLDTTLNFVTSIKGASTASGWASIGPGCFLMAQGWASMAQGCVSMERGWLSLAPDRASMAPGWASMAPRWASRASGRACTAPGEPVDPECASTAHWRQIYIGAVNTSDKFVSCQECPQPQICNLSKMSCNRWQICKLSGMSTTRWQICNMSGISTTRWQICKLSGVSTTQWQFLKLLGVSTTWWQIWKMSGVSTSR